MRDHDEEARAREGRAPDAFGVASAGIALCLGVLAGTVLLSREIEAGLTPRVGDMVRFKPAPLHAFPPAGGGLAAGAAMGAAEMVPRPRLQVEVASETAPGGACTLDAWSLRRGEGSMIVSGQRAWPDGRYVVDWAGRDTAEQGGCPDGARLLLDPDAWRLMRLLSESNGVLVGTDPMGAPVPPPLN